MCAYRASSQATSNTALDYILPAAFIQLGSRVFVLRHNRIIVRGTYGRILSESPHRRHTRGRMLRRRKLGRHLRGRGVVVGRLWGVGFIVYRDALRHQSVRERQGEGKRE